jgi:hypothetical protein
MCINFDKKSAGLHLGQFFYKLMPSREVGAKPFFKKLSSGDTLFLGGCGRFFEGDAVQMNRALNEVLAALDNDTVTIPEAHS